MEIFEILNELQLAGTPTAKKRYVGNGAVEPVFGVTIAGLKPIAKKLGGTNHEIALELYKTGNYDAMYLAGMLADPEKMTEQNFEDWISQAYFFMLSDYTVGVVLADSSIGQKIALKWIISSDEMRQSAGWSAFTWMLGVYKDDKFDKQTMSELLQKVVNDIDKSFNRTKYSMNSFVCAVAISYIPLHNEARIVAEKIGKVCVYTGQTECAVPFAKEYIEKAVSQNKLGFKRKNTRC